MPIKAEDIQKVTKEDEVLSKVCKYIQKGWPAHKKNISKEVQLKQLQLTIHSGYILNGLQVVIPSKMCNAVLAELHEAMINTDSNKTVEVLRSYLQGMVYQKPL